MTPRSVISEAWRDVISGTSRTATLWLLMSAILLTLVVTDSLAVRQFIDSARAYQDSGAATTTITAPGAISGQACDGLAAVPGVQAAGAVRGGDDPLRLTLLPGAPLPDYEVSAGFPGVLNARQTGHGGIYVPDDVVRAVSDGMPLTIATDHGTSYLAGAYTYPADGRRPGFGWAALIPAPSTEPFDECWITTWPQIAAASQLLLTTLAPQASAALSISEVRIGQLSTRLGTRFAGSDGFRDRPTRMAPLIAALAAMLMAAAAPFLRRVELAARLHDGARRQDLHWMTLLETLSWALPAALLATGAGAVLARDVGAPDDTSLLAGAAASAIAAVCGALLGAVLGMWRIREASLFRYFKDR